MIGVIAYWDYPTSIYSLAKSNKIFMNHFRLTMKTFEGTHLIVIDNENQNPECGDAEINFDVVSSLEEAINLVPLKANIVFVEQSEDAVSLKNFQHPTSDAYYVVGSDYSGLPIPNNIETHDFDVVKINIPTAIGFYSYIALGIVLCDRYQKEI